jgi:hypothetical protein
MLILRESPRRASEDPNFASRAVVYLLQNSCNTVSDVYFWLRLAIEPMNNPISSAATMVMFRFTQEMLFDVDPLLFLVLSRYSTC